MTDVKPSELIRFSLSVLFFFFFFVDSTDGKVAELEQQLQTLQQQLQEMHEGEHQVGRPTGEVGGRATGGVGRASCAAGMASGEQGNSNSNESRDAGTSTDDLNVLPLSSLHPSLSFLSVESGLRHSDRSVDSAGVPVTSYLPTFHDLPSVDSIVPDDLKLSQMSPEELAGVIDNLKKELQKAHGQNELLHVRLEAGDTMASEQHESQPAEAQIESLQQKVETLLQQKAAVEAELQDVRQSTKSDQDVYAVRILNKQLELAKEKLAQQEREIVSLRSNTGSLDGEARPEETSGRKETPGFLASQVTKLQAQLRQAQNIIAQYERKGIEMRIARGPQDGEHLKSNADLGGARKETPGFLASQVTKLQAQLKQAQNVNALMKRQIELNTKSDAAPMGFNPELVVQMSNEIQNLKSQRDDLLKKLSDIKAQPAVTISSTSPGDVGESREENSRTPKWQKTDVTGSGTAAPPSGAEHSKVEELNSQLADEKVSEDL